MLCKPSDNFPYYPNKPDVQPEKANVHLLLRNEVLL